MTAPAGPADQAVPDIVGADLDVLFCGINPGRQSGATGWHFARPGNRFWKVLNLAGFTDRQLAPSEQDQLPVLGLGITNLVPEVTARAAELRPADLRVGADRLAATAARIEPTWIAVLGVQAYRVAFHRPRAAIGAQEERLGPAGLWVLPNPSGLQATYQLPELITLYRQLRVAARG